MTNILKTIFKHLVLMVIGGIAYYCVELLYRGYSHWTMFVVGGISFVLIGIVNEHTDWNMPMTLQATIGGLIVTIVEYISGCIINLWLGLNVWDYSNLPFNVSGQICLLFTILWILLSVAVIIADDWLRHWLFKEERPHYIWF